MKLPTAHCPLPTLREHAMRKSGFTLIELSIVLVIIGLLVGGVLVGKELIKAAELRSVITDVDKYRTAVMTFKVKYDCLPGDCPNAQNFFGAYGGAGGCPFSETPATATDQTTCNGNGNGMVWFMESANSYTEANEKNRFWQHLSASRLVAEQYSGIANMDGGQASHAWASDKVGWNIPASKWPNKAGYTIIHSSRMFDTLNGLIPYINESNKTGNKIVIGNETRCNTVTCAFHNSAGIHHAGPVFNGQDAYSVDSKIDDGRPGTGSVRGPQINESVGGLFCADSNDALTAKYRFNEYAGIAASIPSCHLMIDAGF